MVISSYLQRGGMKCINTYFQLKMAVIWLRRFLSLTPSLSTTPRFVLVQPGCSVTCRQRWLTLWASHLSPLPWEDLTAAAVLELLAASLVQGMIPAQSSPPSWVLVVEKIPMSEGTLPPWTISKCTNPLCGRHEKSSRISKWSSTSDFVSFHWGKTSSQQKKGTTSRN